MKNGVLLLRAKHCYSLKCTPMDLSYCASSIITWNLNFFQPQVKGIGISTHTLSSSSKNKLFVLTKQMTIGLWFLSKSASLYCGLLVAFFPPGFVWAHSGSDLPCCICDLQHLCEWIWWQNLHHLGPEPADVHKPASCPQGKPVFCCHQQFNSKIFIYHLSYASMNISW